MTCRCGSARIERVERWATRCAACQHVELSRRSFVVGLGAALGLLAMPKVTAPDWTAEELREAMDETLHEIMGINYNTGNPRWLLHENDWRPGAAPSADRKFYINPNGLERVT